MASPSDSKSPNILPTSQPFNAGAGPSMYVQGTEIYAPVRQRPSMHRRVLRGLVFIFVSFLLCRWIFVSTSSWIAGRRGKEFVGLSTDLWNESELTQMFVGCSWRPLALWHPFWPSPGWLCSWSRMGQGRRQWHRLLPRCQDLLWSPSFHWQPIRTFSWMVVGWPPWACHFPGPGQRYNHCQSRSKLSPRTHPGPSKGVSGLALWQPRGCWYIRKSKTKTLAGGEVLTSIFVDTDLGERQAPS